MVDHVLGSLEEQQVRALGVTEFVRKELSLERLEDALKRLVTSPTSVR